MNLQYALPVRDPIAKVENYSNKDRADFPVSKNFPIKNDFGSSFGSDWPQRFVVTRPQFKGVLEGVVLRWSAELEMGGLALASVEKFTAALKKITHQSSAQD